MNIGQKAEENRLTLSVEGRLNTQTAPELETVINESAVTAHELILDLSGLEYISSAGLRVILCAHKLMAGKGGLELHGMRPAIREIFDMTGFSEILTID